MALPISILSLAPQRSLFTYPALFNITNFLPAFFTNGFQDDLKNECNIHSILSGSPEMQSSVNFAMKAEAIFSFNYTAANELARGRAH